MGTSQSSKGPNSNVPMVPPWVPELPPSPPANNTSPSDGQTDGQDELTTTLHSHPKVPLSIAPTGRFGSAKRSLGSFAKGGDKNLMRRAVGQYVKKGYGGTSTAVRRFSGTLATANKLYSALSSIADGEGQSIDPALAPAVLSGKSAKEIIDAVIQTVSPVTGAQDAEASRVAINDAFSDLLVKQPDADLLNLSDIDKNFVIERFISFDVYKRFELDLGLTIQEKAPTVALALSRLKEVREYIRETIALAFQKIKSSGQKLSQTNFNKISQDALRDSLIVFQEYAK